MITYFVTNYFDCWYSEDEGWTVNNSCPEEDIMLPDDDEGYDTVIATLVERGLLKPTAIDKVDVDNYGDSFDIVDKETREPLFGFTLKD